MNQNKLNKRLEYDNNFFLNSSFFDSNLRKKIEKNSGVSFPKLVIWCCHKCLYKPKEFEYIGNEEYVKFFLFAIYRHKETLEKIWLVISKFCDKGFKLRLIDNRKQFKQYLWEMYLKYYFVIKQYDIGKNNKNYGPDIYIVNNKSKSYYECISPDIGNNDYKVPEMKFNGVDKVPLDKIKDRFKRALNDKVIKYKEYIEKGLLEEKDNLWIAVNTGGLSNYGDLMDITYPLLLEVCKETNFFENNKFINGVIYNHKSIFEYDDKFKVIIIDNNYNYIEDEIII